MVGETTFALTDPSGAPSHERARIEQEDTCTLSAEEKIADEKSSLSNHRDIWEKAFIIMLQLLGR